MQQTTQSIPTPKLTRDSATNTDQRSFQPAREAPAPCQARAPRPLQSPPPPRRYRRRSAAPKSRSGKSKTSKGDRKEKTPKLQRVDSFSWSDWGISTPSEREDGPKIYPWGTTNWIPYDPTLDDGDSDGESVHWDWWKCIECKGHWRSTGRVGWEEAIREGFNNRVEGRRGKACAHCGGILWEPRSTSRYRTPSPSGDKAIDGKRCISAGFEGPNLKAGHFQIRMITVREEDTPMETSGEDRFVGESEGEPPEYETPEEDAGPMAITFGPNGPPSTNGPSDPQYPILP